MQDISFINVQTITIFAYVRPFTQHRDKNEMSQKSKDNQQHKERIEQKKKTNASKGICLTHFLKLSLYHKSTNAVNRQIIGNHSPKMHSQPFQECKNLVAFKVKFYWMTLKQQHLEANNGSAQLWPTFMPSISIQTQGNNPSNIKNYQKNDRLNIKHITWCFTL